MYRFDLNKYLPPICKHYINNIRHTILCEKYSNLIKGNIKYKNLHSGKRCFIIGSGKSILKEDLSMLFDQPVIALNNLFQHESYDKFMSISNCKYHLVAPIHGPQNESDWLDWFKNMQNCIPENVTYFFGLNNYKNNIHYIKSKYNLFKESECNWFYSGIDTSNIAFTNNSNSYNFSKLIWRSNSAGIYGLLLAQFMGFNEIFLLGMDHNYICNDIENYRFYKNATHQLKENIYIKSDLRRNENLLKATAEIFQQYRLINENSNMKIYNCSNESLLDMFEHKNLKDII